MRPFYCLFLLLAPFTVALAAEARATALDIAGLKGSVTDLGGGKTQITSLQVKCGESWKAVGGGAACATVARQITGHTADDMDYTGFRCSADAVTLASPIKAGARVDTAKVCSQLR